MVCELCRTRATHEGWMREADGHPVIVSATRGRRGAAFMGRLRPRRVARDEAAYAAEEDAFVVGDTAHGADDAVHPVGDAAAYAGEPLEDPIAGDHDHDPELEVEGQAAPEAPDDEWLDGQ